MLPVGVNRLSTVRRMRIRSVRHTGLRRALPAAVLLRLGLLRIRVLLVRGLCILLLVRALLVLRLVGRGLVRRGLPVLLGVRILRVQLLVRVLRIGLLILAVRGLTRAVLALVTTVLTLARAVLPRVLRVVPLLLIRVLRRAVHRVAVLVVLLHLGVLLRLAVVRRLAGGVLLTSPSLVPVQRVLGMPRFGACAPAILSHRSPRAARPPDGPPLVLCGSCSKPAAWRGTLP